MVDKLIAQAGSADFIQTFKDAAMFANQFTNESFTGGNVQYVQNTFIDVLNRASTTEWHSIAEKFPSLSADVDSTVSILERYNNFLGLNIGNSPSFIVHEALESGAYLMVVAALAVPVLSALTQWINTKLMPQAETNNNSQDNPMASSMKTMNVMMPIMSAIFCYSFPAGMGIYWIAGSVVRSVQQVIINKHIDKMDLEEVIKQNLEKNKKKLEKKKDATNKMLSQYATMNTKSISTKANSVTAMSQEEREEAVRKSTEYYNKNAKAGSIAAKANMVKQYNEKNNRK